MLTIPSNSREWLLGLALSPLKEKPEISKGTVKPISKTDK